ncbi:hypothetical protein C8J57DRAFT_1332574 [Mycena rebaudengoi]|nr:hypothetical protein C8J57DRAFT_1332574 [Mycena rebaudengoi]
MFDPALFAPFWAIMVDIICLTCTNLLLYGLYIVLFIFSLRTLAPRNVPRRRLLVGTTIVMFLLGTCGTFVVVAMAGVSIRITKAVVLGSADLPRLIGVLNVLQLTDVVRGLLNNVVADLLLLYRCYIIWGSKKKILIVPALCILATVVLTVVCWLPKAYIHPRTPFIMTLGTNLLLMFLTAGRIWYVGREMQTVLHHSTLQKQYNTAIMMVVESGAIYCLCLVLWVISLTTLVSNYNGEFAAIFSGITGGLVTQTANIAPTLILVRVGMGRQWTQDTISIGERVPSDDNIKFRIPVQPAESFPVIEIQVAGTSRMSIGS